MTTIKNPIRKMEAAYIEAVYFTDTGDSEQPTPDAELTDLFRAQAYLHCRDFFWAMTEDLNLNPNDFDWSQIGHDLWLTRNGHGTGFWDRQDLYGDNARIFSAMAKAMGNHDAEWFE